MVSDFLTRHRFKGCSPEYLLLHIIQNSWRFEQCFDDSLWVYLRLVYKHVLCCQAATHIMERLSLNEVFFFSEDLDLLPINQIYSLPLESKCCMWVLVYMDPKKHTIEIRNVFVTAAFWNGCPCGQCEALMCRSLLSHDVLYGLLCLTQQHEIWYIWLR